MGYLKYDTINLVFLEIPNEISLCINLTNCPFKCEGCHSPHLREDNGKVLNRDLLLHIMDMYSLPTCILFMGGDSDTTELNKLAKYVKDHNSKMKVGWYSGQDSLDSNIDLNYFDYIKIGSYKQELGGLNNPNTNQRLYKVEEKALKDITYKFW